jgi:hypothetical protein
LIAFSLPSTKVSPAGSSRMTWLRGSPAAGGWEVVVVGPVGAVVVDGLVVAVVSLAGPDRVVVVVSGDRVGAVVESDDRLLVAPPRVGSGVALPARAGRVIVVLDDAVLVGGAAGLGTVVGVEVAVDDGAAGAVVVGVASNDLFGAKPSFVPRRFFRLAPARTPVPVVSLRGIPTEPATRVVRTSSWSPRRADSATTPIAMSSATKIASPWIS